MVNELVLMGAGRCLRKWVSEVGRGEGSGEG